MFQAVFLLIFLHFYSVLGQDESYTLLDIIAPHSTSRLFDTLSASVASEYAGRPIAFDSASVIDFEERPVNIRKLNAKYKDYLYQGDMLIHPDHLEELVDGTTNAVDAKGNRKKRKAFLNRQYPSTIWNGGVPYSLHWTLRGYNYVPETFLKLIRKAQNTKDTGHVTVFYTFAEVSITGAASRASIIRAITFWQANTCIDFRARTTEKQYVEFIGNDDGCWSTVGKDPYLGRQVISIGKGCEHFGVTSHELAHSLGVFHEQSRWDRDGYVRVNTQVVDSTLLFNFAKVPHSDLAIYGYPYDVGSVMHYTPTEFSRYRSIPALTTVDPNLQQTMGQMEGPTFLDVAVLNSHYRCQNRCPRQLGCHVGGITNSRNCNQCICPSGFGGQLCETVPQSFSQGCGGIINVEEAVRRFDITIRQGAVKKEKQCFYHLRAPQGKRILINIIRVYGRCLEGCWQDGIELKMQPDYRAVGYRLCCPTASQRRILSRTHVVPLIVSSRTTTTSITLEYTYVDSNIAFDEDTTSATTDSTATPESILSHLDGEEEIVVKDVKI